MVLVLGMETCKTRFVTFSPENIYLGAGSANSLEHEVPYPDLLPEFLSGCIVGQRLQWL